MNVAVANASTNGLDSEVQAYSRGLTCPVHHPHNHCAVHINCCPPQNSTFE
jgi:hypothetical protein